MSQNDFNIANQGFPSFRSDLNSALQALASCSSGSAAPTTTYANMLWMDTANNKLKVRNEDNDAWIDLFDLNQTADTAMLAGVTATVAELNVLDGVTGIASQSEALDGTNNSTLMTPLRVAQAARPAFATAVASTSGTAIDFTGIPSWARRVTVMLDEVSTNGTSPIVLQVGNGSFVTTGYSSRFDNFNSTIATQIATTSFGIFDDVVASTTQTAVAVLSWISANTWLLHGTSGSSAPSVGVFSGRIALAGALDRVRITTSGGVNTFDAGTINISWE